jgi:hypothetical protein
MQEVLRISSDQAAQVVFRRPNLTRLTKVSSG